MMPNNNIEVVHHHQMVVVRIRLRHMKKLKKNKTKRSIYFIRTVNCSCLKILVIIKVRKVILIIIEIITIITTIITIITKCKDRSRTPTTNYSKVPLTLYNSQKSLNYITKSTTLDVVWVLYASLKQLVNKGTPCCLNFLLRTLPRLISQGYL